MPKLPGLNIKDIRSVTDFQRNARSHVARLRKTKAPMVLTVNGSAAVVVQDAASYQELLNVVENYEYEREFVAAVNEGLRDVAEGRVYAFPDAFDELEKKLDL